MYDVLSRKYLASDEIYGKRISKHKCRTTIDFDKYDPSNNFAADRIGSNRMAYEQFQTNQQTNKK